MHSLLLPSNADNLGHKVFVLIQNTETFLLGLCLSSSVALIFFALRHTVRLLVFNTMYCGQF